MGKENGEAKDDCSAGRRAASPAQAGYNGGFPAAATMTATAAPTSTPSRPHIFTLAWPLLIELVLAVAIGIVGTSLASHLSDTAGAAFAVAHQISVTLFLLFRIVGSGIGVVITQSLGGGQRARADKVALGLVLGGALGNILDRTLHGYVTDFLDLHFGQWRPFLIFNVGDAAISIGVVILLLRAFVSRKDQAKGSGPEERTEHA